MSAPLSGLVVVELARVLAGPWIGQTLADLGAEVIKVESPAGDETRYWGPPFIERKGEKNAAYFHCCNRGKRGLVADLKSEAGQHTVRALAARADVLVENFRVGALAKYNLDYPTLSRSNPRLVYCSISGFGQDGPDATLPGYDFLVQAAGGLMSVTGEPSGEGMKVGVAFADLFTALYGVVAIQAALRAREQSGRGQHIDICLMDSMVGVMANQAMNYLATGIPPGRLGNMHPNIAPYQSLPVADGAVIIAVGNNRQFAALCDLLGISRAAQDTRYADNAARVKNRSTLTTLLSEQLSTWKREAFLQAARQADVPAASVNNLAEVFAQPQVQHRGMQISTDGIPGIRTPLCFSDSKLAMERPAPNLGEHSEEIKRELEESGAVERT